jgi:hypothetical protein
MKHPRDWPNYVTEICKIYGFKERLNPICFTPGGTLIGNHEEFYLMLQKKFGIDELPSAHLHMGSKEINESVANSDYEFRYHCSNKLKE